MPGISDATEHSILTLIFNATPWANYADNAAATPETSIFVCLQTADPADAGNLSTNEVTTGAYQNYARVGVLRSATGWTVAASPLGSVSPTSQIDFATGGAASTGASVTNFSVGHSGAGAQATLWYGTVTPAITVGNQVIPSLTTATTITLD